MSKLNDLLAQEGLAFFGRINASVSHELKNILATISESAGLINDLLELADSGRNIDPGRIRSASATISDEIQRGFNTIKQMNTFAHSVDIPIEETKVDDLVALAVDLSQFVSYSCTVDLGAAESPPSGVVTHKLLLMDLFYGTLLHAFRKAGSTGNLGIATDAEGDSVVVVFQNEALDQGGDFPDSNQKLISDVIGARLAAGPGEGEWRISIPAKHPVEE